METSQKGISLLSTVTRLTSRFMLSPVLVIFFAPFVALLFYAVPAADDYCKASLSFNTVPETGVLTVTWLYYTQWSPRWLTTLLESLVMSRLNMVTLYGVLLLIVVLMNVASLWYFFRTIFNVSAARAVFSAGVFYAAWVVSLVSPDQQIYWLTNSMEYNLSLSAMLVLAGLLSRPRTAVWYAPAVVLLSLAIPGLHEIAGTFLCAMLIIGVIAMRFNKRPVWHWCMSLGAAIVSQGVVMMSRGDRIRAVTEHRQLWDLAHAPHWVAHSFFRGIESLSYSSVLLAACCIFMLSVPDGPNHESTVLPKSLGIASLCAIFILLCESALVEVATSSWLPDRVFEWFEFVLWLLFVTVIAAAIPEISRVRFSEFTSIGVYTLFAVMLFGSTNFRNAISDLRGPARAWHAINAPRFMQHGGSWEFQAVSERPHLAKPLMLNADPGCWVNRCLANYLGAKTVIMDNAHDECPH